MPWLSDEFDLLRGQPGELRQMAAAVRSVADLLSGSAVSVVASGAVDPGTWSGESAERWAERIAELPGQISRAAEQLRSAAPALDRFADHLDEAQGQLSSLRSQVAALPHDPPDPSATEERNRLMRRANSARRDVAIANADAERAFDAITAGARLAPRGGGGGLLGHLDRAVGGATDALGSQMVSFGRGVYDGTVGTAISVTELGIDAGRYAVAHPGAVAAGTWDALTRPDRVVAAVWDNKGALLSAAVNYDTLMSDPARWLGQLAPTVLLAATGGGAALRVQDVARQSRALGPVVRSAQAVTGLRIAVEAPSTAASAAWTVAGNLARSETRNTELIRTALEPVASEPVASEPVSPTGDPPTLPCPEPSADRVGAEPAGP